MLTGFVHRGINCTWRGFCWGGGGGLFPGNDAVSDVLVPARGSGRGDRIASYGVAGDQHYWGAGVGFILDHVHWIGLSSWRWLLILEACAGDCCGVLTYFLLPSRPAEASFRPTEEKEWMAGELEREDARNRRRNRNSRRFRCLRMCGCGNCVRSGF